MAKKATSIIPVERIQQCIYMFRGQKVMLDSDLAILYGIETKVLLQAVKRNIGRFPNDFMFKLTSREFANLKSQIKENEKIRGINKSNGSWRNKTLLKGNGKKRSFCLTFP